MHYVCPCARYPRCTAKDLGGRVVRHQAKVVLCCAALLGLLIPWLFLFVSRKKELGKYRQHLPGITVDTAGIFDGGVYVLRVPVRLLTKVYRRKIRRGVV